MPESGGRLLTAISTLFSAGGGAVDIDRDFRAPKLIGLLGIIVFNIFESLLQIGMFMQYFVYVQHFVQTLSCSGLDFFFHIDMTFEVCKY